MYQTKCPPIRAEEEALIGKGKMGQIPGCWAQVSDFKWSYPIGSRNI